MRRADPGHRAGGGAPFAPSRNEPLASAGRSAFALRGSEPPRQLRPALVCLRRDPLWLCEAIRPAFGSLRRGLADPLRHVWLTTRCAGHPLAAAGPIHRRAIGQKRSRPPGRPLQVRLRQPPSTAERHDLSPPHSPHGLVPVHAARPLDALPVRHPIRAASQRNGQGRSGSSNRSACLAGLRSAFAP